MKIKALRMLTGWSQTKFGEFFGISLRTIQNWEGEVRTPPDYVVSLIEYKLRAEGIIE